MSISTLNANTATLTTQLAKINEIILVGLANSSYWTSANDGAGSGLDADLLDGHDTSYFLASSSYTASDVLTKIKTVDGAASGLDADLLDGRDSVYFVANSYLQSLYTASDILTKIKTVDGAASGLDADTLDGRDSVYFVANSYFQSSYTASDVLNKIKTVDGTGSGLDADLLDGHDTSYFQAALSATKGNIMAGNGTTYVTVALGANGQYLTVDTSQTSGLTWNTPQTTPSVGSLIASFIYFS